MIGGRGCCRNLRKRLKSGSGGVFWRGEYLHGLKREKSPYGPENGVFWHFVNLACFWSAFGVHLDRAEKTENAMKSMSYAHFTMRKENGRVKIS
jgi:hypothetical protein